MGFFSAIGGIIGGATGIPGGSIIGSAIGGAVEGGITSNKANKGASAASSSAAQDRADALRSAQEGVDVAKGFLDDFQAIYGGIENNLSTFFSSLTPERFATLGLENVQKEFQGAQDRINQTFAQRGIPDSGLQLSLDTLLQTERAKARANVRSDAPFKVAQAQSKFLALGLPQKSQAQQLLSSAIGNRTNALLGFAEGSTQAAANAAAGAGKIQGEFGAAKDTLFKAVTPILTKALGDFIG